MQPATNGETYVDTGVGDPDRLARLWAPYRSSYITQMPAGEETGEAEGSSRSTGDPFLDIPEMSDEDGLIVARGETVLSLTARELSLLEFLLRRRGSVVTKQEIINNVWDFNFEGDPNIVEVYVARLRRKVDRPFDRADIETLRGSGYRLRPSTP